MASVSNAVQIQVMNFVYSFIANALSERENHRTDTEVPYVLCADAYVVYNFFYG